MLLIESPFGLAQFSRLFDKILLISYLLEVIYCKASIVKFREKPKCNCLILSPKHQSHNF